MILNKIFSWVNALFAARTYTLRNFTAFLLLSGCASKASVKAELYR